MPVHSAEDRTSANLWNDGDTSVADRSTWWSPQREFSPPLIQYVPGPLQNTVYTVCDLNAVAATTTGKIEIAQAPMRPSSFRADLAYMPAGGDVESSVRFDVFTYGALKKTEGIFDCRLDTYDEADLAALGGIWHPLKEVRNGVVNPFADPERGLIRDVKRDTEAWVTGIEDTQVQMDLLLDLGGGNSLIGRTIFATEIDSSKVTKRNDLTDAEGATATILGCCIVAQTAGPNARLPTIDEVWQQPAVRVASAPQNGHGHGGGFTGYYSYRNAQQSMNPFAAPTY